MLLASRHSIIAEEQGAQQECSSTLSSLFGVSIFNIILFVFLLGRITRITRKLFLSDSLRIRVICVIRT